MKKTLVPHESHRTRIKHRGSNGRFKSPPASQRSKKVDDPPLSGPPDSGSPFTSDNGSAMFGDTGSYGAVDGDQDEASE